MEYGDSQMPQAKRPRKGPQPRRENGGSNEIGARLDAVRADLEKLEEGAAALPQDAGDAASEGYKTAMRAAQKIAERSLALAEEASTRMGDAARDAAESMQDWADLTTESFRGAVKEKPARSILVSLGAGALVGALISRL
jgi:ElaB/YqjD/DUF883 family membrane-anchored ribosome-binding protein